MKSSACANDVLMKYKKTICHVVMISHTTPLFLVVLI